MTPRKPKEARELAARALCRHAGIPENIVRNGRPMWQDFLPEADAVLTAIGFGEDNSPVKGRGINNGSDE